MGLAGWAWGCRRCDGYEWGRGGYVRRDGNKILLILLCSVRFRSRRGRRERRIHRGRNGGSCRELGRDPVSRI